MTTSKAKMILSLIFLISIIVNVIFAFFKVNRVWPDHFVKLLVTILGIYSVHIAAVFGASSFSPSKSSTVNWNLFVFAVLLCIIWNALLLVRTGQFAFKKTDDIAEVTEYLTIVSLAGSFLVVGVITAFFAKANNENT